jgi:hypothetical protein
MCCVVIAFVAQVFEVGLEIVSTCLRINLKIVFDCLGSDWTLSDWVLLSSVHASLVRGSPCVRELNSEGHRI